MPGGEWQANPTIVTTGGAGNLFATNELKIDMHSKIRTSYAKTTPLTTILTRIASDPAHNFRVDLQEAQEIPTTVQVGTALASGGTALVLVDNGTCCVAGTLLYNPRADDMAQVTTATSDTALVITRSAAGTTAAAWVAGDILHVLPPAIAENESAVYRPASVADDNIYNYTQLIRLQYAINRVANEMTTHFGGPGSKRAQQRRQKYREARIKLEKLLYFGGRATSGSAPAEVRTMGGLVYRLRNGTLYKDFSNIFTETGFDNWLGDFQDQNPDTSKLAFFCAGNVRRLISYWGKGKVRVSPNSKKYGLRVDQYIGPMDVDLIPLPLLNDPVTKGWGWLLDLERIQLKPLDNSGLAYYGEALNVGESEIIYDTYRGVYSMLLANESRHAMMVGALV